MLHTTQIMIADEDSFFVESICHTLHQSGNFSIRTTCTGIDVRDCLYSHCPDVLLIDMMIPDINILTILNDLHVLPADQRPFIVVLSSFVSRETIAECTRLGINFFLRKPVDPEKLTDIILRYTTHSPSDSACDKQEIMLHISKILNQLQFPTHTMGYRYIKDSVWSILEQPLLAESVTKQLYPFIAKQYQVTWTSLERDIRNAVSIAWERCGGHFSGFYFPKRPANREFIFTLAERVTFDLHLDLSSGIAQ